MPIKLANNASAHLAAPLAADGTTIVLVTAETGNFPALAAGEWFPLTLTDSAGRIEIARATARSGNLFTATRGQEGTTALAWLAGDRAEIRLTAAAIDQLQTDTAQVKTNLTQEVADRSAADTTLTNGLALKFDKAGGTVTGDITTYRSATPTTGTIYFGNSGARYLHYDGTNYAMPGAPLYVQGSAVWHAGNFNPGSYAPLGGATFTGKVNSATINSAMTQNDVSCALEVRSSGAAGDGALAMLGFLSSGAYGIKLGLRADGYFGLGGWSAPAWRWYVGPNGDMYASGNVTAYSDPRLKDDVVRIDGALAIIEQLDGVRFTWNRKTELVGKPGQRDIGVLADQVEAVLPEIVGRSMPDEKNGGEQWRVVAYDKLTPVLIEAVKELASMVRKLEGL